MSSVPSPKVLSAGARARALPFLVYFEDEHQVRITLASVSRFRRLSLGDAIREPEEIDRVLISSSEQALLQHQDRLRKPNIRVIALTSQRFRDPRVDGLVYSY